MRVRLLKPQGNYKAGVEIEVPWASVARRMIADGIAVDASRAQGKIVVTDKTTGGNRKRRGN